MDIEKMQKKFWKNNPDIHEIFKSSDTYSAAQTKLHDYISKFWIKLYQVPEIERSLDLDIQMNALRTLRTIISTRSFKLTGFNIVELMWNLVHENFDSLPESLNDGFFNELEHLFLAVTGKSGLYDDLNAPRFLDKHGREAAVIRSDHLNDVADGINKKVESYSHGLQDSIIKSRTQNREHILKTLGGEEENWDDYTWHLRNVVRDVDTLGSLIDLSNEEVEAINLAKSINLPFGITPYYISLMDKKASRKNDHAVRAQVIPPLHYARTMEKYRGDEAYCADFMLERDTSPIDLITRRYPYIAIFKPYNTCAQICVYCQRNWQITDVLDPMAEAPQDALEKAYDWFEKNKEVDEILVTGGDPLILNTAKLQTILERLASMKHVRRIRIGSRTPVVLPQRITSELADTIGHYHIPGQREVAISTHFEHVYEVSPEAMKAVQMFKSRGMSVYNQAVYTMENSRRFEMVALRRQLRLIGVDSYYTFNTKGKEETNNYRVPMARLQQEVSEEARLLPGLTRTDEAVYNVPKLGKNYLRAEQNHSLLTILPNGRRMYEFHPWEKYLSRASTYIDTDVSITTFLEEMKNRGEKLEDYKSIWFYY